MGGSYYKNGRGKDPQNRFLMGKFINKTNGKTKKMEGCCLETNHRSLDYEDGVDERKTEKNGGIF
jgi:hypothetical protein